ncbi:MAG: YjbQ family protein, partial [Planctomycetes bacterium]|nr:YjbQ family protein [Planctomycetota bacterium]
ERTEFVDITTAVAAAVQETGVQSGICLVYVPHTTASVTINENADPSVTRDILAELNRLVPFDGGYTHSEGNSAAHIKSTLVGCSQLIPIANGRLALGTWQGIYFCEFDGPRTREAYVEAR